MSEEAVLSCAAPGVASWGELLGHAEERARLAAVEPFGALLLSGPQGLGKRLVAFWYAAWLNCRERPESFQSNWACHCTSCRKLLSGNHPDLLLLERATGKLSLGVGDVREGLAQLNTLPYEGGYRVWIITDAEKLTDEAQNALLKTLEEPPRRTLIVLVASQESALLPTVLSRCRIVRLRPVSSVALGEMLEGRGVLTDTAQVLSRLAEGRPGTALRLAQDKVLWNLRETVLAGLGELPGAPLWPALETAARWEALRGQPPDPRRDMEQVLGTCQSWYRDLLLVAAGLADSAVNVHHRATLVKLAGRLGPERARRGLVALREAEEQLQGNVQARFVMQSLCLALARGGDGA